MNKAAKKDIAGRVAETLEKVGDLPKGHQVILLRALDNSRDPLILCESRGRAACVHRSEIKILNARFEV